MFSAGPDLGAGARLGADRLHGEAMAQHDVMSGLVQFGRRQLEAGRVDAPSVTEIEETSGFVEREDVLDAVGQTLGDIAGVIRERLRGVAGLPAADAVLQRLRQVPMVQRGIGLDAVGQQFVDQAVVEIEAFGIGRAAFRREIPAAMRSKTDSALTPRSPDQADVFLVAMVMLVGAVAGGVVLDLARRVRESVPDRAAAAVFIDGALDLIGRGGGAPQEVLRESSPGRAGRRPAFASVFGCIRRCRRHSERGKARKLCKLPAREFSEHRFSPAGFAAPADQ